MDINSDPKFQFSKKAMLLFSELRIGLTQLEEQLSDENLDETFFTYGTIYSYFLELDEYFINISRRSKSEKIVYFNLGEMFMKYSRILMSKIFYYLDCIYNEDVEDEKRLNLTGQYDRLLLLIEGINDSGNIHQIIMSEEVLEEMISSLQELEISSPVTDIIENYFDDTRQFLDVVSNVAYQEE